MNIYSYLSVTVNRLTVCCWDQRSRIIFLFSHVHINRAVSSVFGGAHAVMHYEGSCPCPHGLNLDQRTDGWTADILGPQRIHFIHWLCWLWTKHQPRGQKHEDSNKNCSSVRTTAVKVTSVTICIKLYLCRAATHDYLNLI